MRDEAQTKQKFHAKMALPAFYVVVTAWKDKVIADEREIIEANADSWAELVSDVWNGQYTEILKVLKVDAANGTSEDLTDAMADALSARSFRDEAEPDTDVCDFLSECKRDYFTPPEPKEYRRPSQWSGWF